MSANVAKQKNNVSMTCSIVEVYDRPVATNRY